MLKPGSWDCLRFVKQDEVVNENVSDVVRRSCICGDGVWWRIKPSQPWRCRTCRPPNAKAKVFWIRRRRSLVDPTDNEVDAIMAASEPAGEYLESLGETDLAKLSEENWLTLLEVIVTAYLDNLKPPF